jgi:hypothetical protein
VTPASLYKSLGIADGRSVGNGKAERGRAMALKSSIGGATFPIIGAGAL